MGVVLRSSAFVGLACAGLAFACSSSAPQTDGQTLDQAPTHATNPTPSTSGSSMPAPQPQPEPQPTADAGATSTDAGNAFDTCQTAPPNNKCGVSPQCGCAATETCDVTDLTTGAASCVTAGSKTLGRPCQSTIECVPGDRCEYGVCRPYCGQQGAACTITGTGVCIDVPDANDKPIPNLLVCTVSCDPAAPQALCGAGNTCLWFPTLYAPAKVSDCNAPGTTQPLTACKTDFDCTAGYACATHPVYGVECEKWCRMGTQYAADCASGFTCKDVFGANGPTVNGIKEGTCQDP